MSAPSMPPDNSAEVARIQAQQAETQRQAEAAAAEKRRQELAGLRSSAGANARTSAQNYFSQQGLDPAEYASNIDAKINQILTGIGPDETSPGSYFTDIGPTTYSDAETGFRNKATRDLDAIFAPNFETSRIPLTLDDPYLSGIEAEQRGKADTYIKNLLDRGVITPTGYTAAQGDVDKQAPGVRARLNEIGTGTLTGGQQQLRDVSQEARTTASGLKLGTSFNPQSYASRTDQLFNDFISNLGDTLRSKVVGDLFSTAGLANIAGAGQGAQNTKFDPAALAGAASDDEEDKKSSTSIF